MGDRKLGVPMLPESAWAGPGRDPGHKPGRDPGRDARPLRVFALATVLVAAVLLSTGAARGADEPPVFVVEVTGVIDLGLAPYLERVLREAQDAGAATVVLEIDTPGGRLDAVLQMRDSLLGSRVRTVAYVDRLALSAGALVALASHDIYVAPGSVIGAATPVLGDTGEAADEKVVSAVRSTFRATAEERGRDPRVAEAMVDPAVDVPGLIGSGQLLTLTVSEAVEWGYADGVATDRADLLAQLDLADHPVVETSPRFAERIVRVLTNPALASLLLMLGVLLFLGDLLSGGIGIPSAVGGGLLAAFFWGHLLAGLAGWEDVALVVVGLGLIVVELLVIPGFGVAGLLGLAALLGGAFMAMLSRHIVTGEQIQRAALAVGLTFAAVIAGLVVGISYLARRGGRGSLVLRAQVGTGTPVTERAVGGWVGWFGGRDVLASDRAEHHDGHEEFPAPTGQAASAQAAATATLVGATGKAVTDLRPAGVVEIDGQRVDVVTQGEYVPAGEEVEVIGDEGYRRVVRPWRPADPQQR